MLFDSHAHLNDERFNEDREELINSLKSNGVELVLNPGACIETSKSSVERFKKANNSTIHTFISIGKHTS